MEVLSAEIQTNKTHIFTFSQTVVQYMIGFSKIVIQYPNRDHHVKEVTIDLTHSNQSNNEILVTPKLVMKDINGNNESNQSTIIVVVIATIGYGNANIYLLNNVKPDLEYVTPLPTASFVKSAIISSTVQYPKIDHHLCKYLLKAERKTTKQIQQLTQ